MNKRKWIISGSTIILGFVLLTAFISLTARKSKDDFFSQMSKVASVKMAYDEEVVVDNGLVSVLMDSDFKEIHEPRSTTETGEKAWVIYFYDKNGSLVYFMQYYADQSTDDSLWALFTDGETPSDEIHTYKITNTELIDFLREYEKLVQ